MTDDTIARLASTPDGHTSDFAALLLRRITTLTEVMNTIAALVADTGIVYEPVPESVEGERGTYLMLLAEPNQDFSAFTRRFTELWGPPQVFDHVTEIGDDDDGEGGRFELFADDAQFEGFKVNGCLIVQYERGSEECIQIYPSANPEPPTPKANEPTSPDAPPPAVPDPDRASSCLGCLPDWLRPGGQAVGQAVSDLGGPLHLGPAGLVRG